MRSLSMENPPNTRSLSAHLIIVNYLSNTVCCRVRLQVPSVAGAKPSLSLAEIGVAMGPTLDGVITVRANVISDDDCPPSEQLLVSNSFLALPPPLPGRVTQVCKTRQASRSDSRGAGNWG